ncbi:MAG: DUF551 domain-containing protein [Candidatus Peribacteraceae bacterium]|nr:DUF551 domain-containing protein [Candidatus Peribacteraceae bacterium]
MNCIICHKELSELEQETAETCFDCMKTDTLKPQWVSVNDRLPKETTAVLVFDEVVGQHVSFFDGSQKFTHPVWPLEDVTHWMPMPEPPEIIKEN